MDVYVEQESVLKTLDEAIKGWCKNCGISRMEYLRIRFRNLPSADVAPVVHGKWKEENLDYLDGDSVYICSVCGETWNLEAGTPQENNMNYCPNCGAKMGL